MQLDYRHQLFQNKCHLVRQFGVALPPNPTAQYLEKLNQGNSLDFVLLLTPKCTFVDTLAVFLSLEVLKVHCYY